MPPDILGIACGAKVPSTAVFSVSCAASDDAMSTVIPIISIARRKIRIGGFPFSRLKCRQNHEDVQDRSVCPIFPDMPVLASDSATTIPAPGLPLVARSQERRRTKRAWVCAFHLLLPAHAIGQTRG